MEQTRGTVIKCPHPLCLGRGWFQNTQFEHEECPTCIEPGERVAFGRVVLPLDPEMVGRAYLEEFTNDEEST